MSRHIAVLLATTVAGLVAATATGIGHPAPSSPMATSACANTSGLAVLGYDLPGAYACIGPNPPPG